MRYSTQCYNRIGASGEDGVKNFTKLKDLMFNQSRFKFITFIVIIKLPEKVTRGHFMQRVFCGCTI